MEGAECRDEILRWAGQRVELAGRGGSYGVCDLAQQRSGGAVDAGAQGDEGRQEMDGFEVERFAGCAVSCGVAEELGHGVAELAHCLHDKGVVDVSGRGRGLVHGRRSVGQNVLEGLAEQ